MRSHLWTVALLLLSSTPSFAHPQFIPEGELVVRDANANAHADADADADFTWYSREKEERDLFKRKGGGGGGGRGGGGGSSSSGGKGGGSSSSSGGSSSSSSSGGRGSTSSSSNAGGATRSGSGPAPAYGGGRYYGGGAATPYSAGTRSPLGIAPIFLGVGVLAVLPGLWLFGAYSYPYHNPYSFRNHSATRNSTNDTNTAVVTRQDSGTGVNETRPVLCLCAAYSVCGCDDNEDSTFLDQLIGDGSYAALNKTLINVADVNGTTTIILNGTLPNGTTASEGTDSAAGRTIAEGMGWWVMITVVFATCFAI